MTSKTNLAYKMIKEELLSGKISVETPLSESIFATKLNISRTPVRSAIQRLEVEGFLRVVPNQGIIIREISIKEASELYELRQIVEEYLIDKSISLLTEEDFIKLEKYLRLQREAITNKDFHGYLELDKNMHLFCYHNYENDPMKNVLKNYSDRLYSVRYESAKSAFLSSDGIFESMNEHANFITALRDYDVELAKEVLKRHLNRGIMEKLL